MTSTSSATETEKPEKAAYRLHELEGALELFSTDPFVFRPSELYGVEGALRKELERYNIYFVARRPRLSLDASTLKHIAGTNQITGLIFAQVGQHKQHIRFIADFSPFFDVMGIRDHEFPFDILKLHTSTGPVQLRLNDVLRFSKYSDTSLTDMFVEYIGQAFGERGERDVVDRLIGNTGKAGHGSLQQVLAEVNATHPDQEVHLLLYSFEFHKRYAAAGSLIGDLEPINSIENNFHRFDQFFEEEVTRRARIDLVEASLIRYFAPRYNQQFKKTFPAQTHKILNRLHELDITGLAISLSTLEHRIRLWSDAIEPAEMHLAMFSITQDEQRLSYFDLTLLANEPAQEHA